MRYAALTGQIVGLVESATAFIFWPFSLFFYAPFYLHLLEVVNLVNAVQAHEPSLQVVEDPVFAQEDLDHFQPQGVIVLFHTRDCVVCAYSQDLQLIIRFMQAQSKTTLSAESAWVLSASTLSWAKHCSSVGCVALKCLLHF